LSRVILIASLLAAGCGNERLARVEGALTVQPAELELPAAWVGFSTAARFELQNAGRARRQVTLSVSPPFSTSTALTLEGGSVALVEVGFAPGTSGDFADTMQIESEGQRLQVAVHGLAQQPLDCHASAQCHQSTFDPASGACVETTDPDETPCSLGSVCVEGARCHAGACLGAELSCDDADACTTDACDPANGCLHLPLACPSPRDPCKVGACDPARGCTVADAADGTRCGPADCTTAQVCLAGACKTVSVPEGFTCAEASPCQGKGTCHSQECEQPAPAPLTPAWSYTVPQGRTLLFDGLADGAGNLYWAECPGGQSCELVSATRDGFIRFRATMPGAVARTPGVGLLAIVGGNVISALGGLEARRTTDGALVWQADLLALLTPWFHGVPPDDVSAGSIAEDGQGNVVVLAAPHSIEDGTGSASPMLVSLDAATGTLKWQVKPGAQLYALASDEVGNLFAPAAAPPPSGSYGQWEQLVMSWTSSGSERWRAPSSGWVTALSVAGGRIVESDSATGLKLTSSGASAQAPDGGFAAAISTREAVFDSVHGYQFFEPTYACCPMCSCPAFIPQVHLRGFGSANAEVNWQMPVDPFGYSSWSTPTVSEVLLTARGDALYARSPYSIYALPIGDARLEAVTSSGTQRFSCQLPGPAPFDAIAYSGSAALLSDRWVIASQPQCYGCVVGPQPVIEAFDVPGDALAPHGWVAQRGNAQRSGRPR
jgi:hypothetical protein